MSCEKVQEQISLMLDRQVAADDWVDSQAHIASCRRCEAHLESTRELRAGLRAMAKSPVPAQLTARLKVMASHEHARKVERLNMAARIEAWRGNIRLFFDNLMRPFAVPVTGGLFTAMLMFSILLPTLNPFQRSSAYEPPLAIVTDPDGEIVGPSHGLRLQPGDAMITGNEVSLVLFIDERGHVGDYYLSGGELTDDMKSVILFSRLKPATIDGQPTWGLMQVVYRPAAHRHLRS